MTALKWLRDSHLPLRWFVSAVFGCALLLLVLGQRAVAHTAIPVLPVAIPAALVLAFLFGFALSGRLLTLLAQLQDGIHGMTSGDHESRVARSRVRELNEISVAFNTMADSLQESTEQLEHQAFHDPLTGLPNRALFMSSFSQALSWALQHKRSVAVLFMDVDRFKYLNDSLGHGVGDQLLAVLSRRLVAAAGGHLVARLGGDEFTMLVTGPDPEIIAREIAERIATALQQPFSIAGHELFVSMSIGAAASKPTDKTITELLRKADIALYRAKADGRARFIAFSDDIDALSAEQFDLDNALRRAVERGELILYYQPIIDLPTNAIVGMEALLRWNHPHRGILSPAMFISMAEESGEIVRIGKWVLEEACRQTVEFQRLLPGKPLTVAVNLSASEFRQPGLAERIAHVLDTTGLTPRQLKLELTESVLIGDVPETLEILSELKGLGVGLSIDDFGTGYSSLNYLQRLPVDTLKVDQSFVGSLGQKATAGPVLRAIVELGNALFMQVVAEGIETRAQLEFLGSIGCQFGQGHYF
ncbi:MAG: sensor domain-containing phosphodiesterase, partial [Tepidiformaceae bacterium]